jgi:hypothetical protein
MRSKLEAEGHALTQSRTTMLQTILIVLVPVALLAWRLRRLINVLRGEGAAWKKYLVAGVIAFGIIARVGRYLSSGSDATAVAEARGLSDVDSVQVEWSAKATALLAEGEEALSRCDTATANYAFRRVAGIGIDMMNADSLDGEPLFVQGVALAGLRDTVNAKVLFDEGARLDRGQGMPADDEHAETLQRIVTLAKNGCSAPSAD